MAYSPPCLLCQDLGRKCSHCLSIENYKPIKKARKKKLSKVSPVKRAPAHGLDRKDLLSGNAYIQEPE